MIAVSSLLMKTELSDKKIQKAVDILDLCVLALKFYIASKELKYLKKLRSEVSRLDQLLNNKEGVK
jgi:hypothetical protein